MSSPVGHAVAGLIVALATERRTSALGKLGFETQAQLRAATAPIPWTLFFVCMFLAALPDLDYLYAPIHRGPTHSLGAVAIVTTIAAGVTRWMTGRVDWRNAVVCGLAYGSHIFIDWLAEDPTLTPGLQLLWPLSDRLFLSGWNLFRSTWRLDPLAPENFVHNVKTLVQEMAILAPLLIVLWWRRNRQTIG